MERRHDARRHDAWRNSAWRHGAPRQLAKDVLSDFTEIFKSMATRYQPLGDNENADEAKFEKWARLAVDCAARTAPFQSPTFRAITLVPPDSRGDDVRSAQEKSR
jgi:hypothetical protein